MHYITGSMGEYPLPGLAWQCRPEIPAAQEAEATEEFMASLGNIDPVSIVQWWSAYLTCKSRAFNP